MTKRVYSCDFETTNTNPARVWAWGIANIFDFSNFMWGTNIEDFINLIFSDKYNKSTLYFHNLAHDGMYIMHYLITVKNFNIDNTNYPYIDTLIGKMGEWYTIHIFLSKEQKIEIRDSYKKIRMSISDMAIAYKAPILKGEIDYDLERPENYVPTEEEIEYLRNDVIILCCGLRVQYLKGMTGLTISGDALKFYKKQITDFRNVFPLLDLETDANCRKALKGAFCYVNDRYKNIEIYKKGCVLDVNSMYAWGMLQKIPYCNPLYCTIFEDLTDDSLYDVFIIHIQADFEIKDGYLPTINGRGFKGFWGREYITDSKGGGDLWLTSLDYELFHEHYYVYEEHFLEGYKFKSSDKLFKDYVDYFYEIKMTAKDGIRAWAKAYLVSLYGKLTANPDVTGKDIYVDDDSIIRLKDKEKEVVDPIYSPAGIFVLAWGRYKIINDAQKCYDMFAYADTDSLHLLTERVPEHINISNSKLGEYKLEYYTKASKYIHAKCYMEIKSNDEPLVVCAGLPKKLGENITFEMFKPGLIVYNKPKRTPVKGGVILLNTEFTIKGDLK